MFPIDKVYAEEFVTRIGLDVTVNVSKSVHCGVHANLPFHEDNQRARIWASPFRLCCGGELT